MSSHPPGYLIGGNTATDAHARYMMKQREGRKQGGKRSELTRSSPARQSRVLDRPNNLYRGWSAARGVRRCIRGPSNSLHRRSSPSLDGFRGGSYPDPYGLEPSPANDTGCDCARDGVGGCLEGMVLGELLSTLPDKEAAGVELDLARGGRSAVAWDRGPSYVFYAWAIDRNCDEVQPTQNRRRSQLMRARSSCLD
jgi:hypothetical protein